MVGSYIWHHPHRHYTWVIENLDNVEIRFIRQWLDLTLRATLSGIILGSLTIVIIMCYDSLGNAWILEIAPPSVAFYLCH